MVWVNSIVIIVLAIALFKQCFNTKKSVEKIKKTIFNPEDGLQKKISRIEDEVEKLKTRVSTLNPEGIVERINNIKKELEESFSGRFDQIKEEMKKLQGLFGNYVSKIEGRISLIDKIGQKISQISSGFEEKIKALLRAKKTEK